MSILEEVGPENSVLNIRQRRNLNTKIFRNIVKTAGKIRGATVIHINATSAGGVAELLRSQVVLERVLRLKSRWLCIRASRPFF